MIFKSLFSAVAFASALLIPTAASAAPVTVDGGWYGFCFSGPGAPAIAGCQNDGVGVSGNSTTFTATGPVLFKITDAFDFGESFHVSIDGGAMSFTTPSVPANGSTAESTSDPDMAYVDPNYSHGSLLLGAGFHTVDVFAANAPFGPGGAYLEVVSVATPEPASVALLGSGLLVAAFAKRRFRK